MERLVEAFRPRTLSEVCGHPDLIETLQAYAAERTSRCIGLIGPPATGKTSTALAFMHDCGATDGYPGVCYKNGSEFTGMEAKGEARRTYDWMRCCPLFAECNNDEHVHGVVIEECSKMSQDAIEFFKSSWEVCLPDRAIVIVTSNDVSSFQKDKIGKAFLDRFEWFKFDDTPDFRQAAMKRARRIWQHVLTREHGMELPTEDQFSKWAKDLEGNGFSMRRLLSQIERKLAVVKHNAKTPAQRRAEADATCNF